MIEQTSLLDTNESFDELLRYIPAKYYLVDEDKPEPAVSLFFRWCFILLDPLYGGVETRTKANDVLGVARTCCSRQAPLTKAQKKAAKKKSGQADVKLAKSEALRKAKLARVSYVTRKLLTPSLISYY